MVRAFVFRLGSGICLSVSLIIEDDFDKTFAELAGGVDILMAGNLAVRVDGSWMKSDDVEVYGASGKVQLKF